MKNKLLLVLALSALLLGGCVSQKDVAYFNGINSESADSINRYFQTNHEAIICNGDMLSITVAGLDPMAVAPFNLPLVSYATPGSDELYSAPTLQTYLVDVNGTINFPVIGIIKIGGLTKSQAIKLNSSSINRSWFPTIYSLIFIKQRSKSFYFLERK